MSAASHQPPPVKMGDDAKRKDGHEHEVIGVFQLVILVLSLVVLGGLMANTVFPLPPEIARVLKVVDTVVCVVFLIDFIARFRRARSKLEFLKWGWIDLVASIPNLPILRVGRLVRIIKIIQLLRAVRATHKITRVLLKDRLQTGIASVLLTSVLLLLFSSVGILICERPNPDGNIKTAEDAIWWSVNTITTVGCADKYPVTSEGRLLGMVLMISGVGLFGGLTGLVASVFVTEKEKEIETEENKILKRLNELEAKIDRLNKGH
jgi:voltage-gated potassium channel